ncbi:uncharacterized protein [Atheta coriaria]|uniref:uncharacterized protein n=1 Tax=Dalotia coriaria TaxID=877792 RepID=UPI0031F36BCF
MRRIIFAILCFNISIIYSQNSTQNKNSDEDSMKILSRRKRYLIFPEGSSLQLVYCLTMPVIGKSTIFTIGGTAALAWELPHDPFQPYRKKAELLHRKDPPGKYTILDPIANKKQSPPATTKVSQSAINLLGAFNDQFGYSGYQNPISINYSPAYNRYRYQNYQNRRRQQFPQQQPVHYRFSQPIQLTKGDRVTSAGSRGEVYYKSTPSSPASIYHQVHRRTRRDLYGKIEKFLSTQSKDGKACLLRAICEVHQKGSEKGSFMEEILKAIFKVKPIDDYENEDIYDHSANKTHNCKEMYPSCDASILKFI